MSTYGRGNGNSRGAGYGRQRGRGQQQAVNASSSSPPLIFVSGFHSGAVSTKGSITITQDNSSEFRKLTHQSVREAEANISMFDRDTRDPPAVQLLPVAVDEIPHFPPEGATHAVVACDPLWTRLRDDCFECFEAEDFITLRLHSIDVASRIDQGSDADNWAKSFIICHYPYDSRGNRRLFAKPVEAAVTFELTTLRPAITLECVFPLIQGRPEAEDRSRRRLFQSAVRLTHVIDSAIMTEDFLEANVVGAEGDAAGRTACRLLWSLKHRLHPTRSITPLNSCKELRPSTNYDKVAKVDMVEWEQQQNLDAAGLFIRMSIGFYNQCVTEFLRDLPQAVGWAKFGVGKVSTSFHSLVVDLIHFYDPMQSKSAMGKLDIYELAELHYVATGRSLQDTMEGLGAPREGSCVPLVENPRAVVAANKPGRDYQSLYAQRCILFKLDPKRYKHFECKDASIICGLVSGRYNSHHNMKARIEEVLLNFLQGVCKDKTFALTATVRSPSTIFVHQVNRVIENCELPEEMVVGCYMNVGITNGQVKLIPNPKVGDAAAK